MYEGFQTKQAEGLPADLNETVIITGLPFERIEGVAPLNRESEYALEDDVIAKVKAGDYNSDQITSKVYRLRREIEVLHQKLTKLKDEIALFEIKKVGYFDKMFSLTEKRLKEMHGLEEKLIERIKHKQYLAGELASMSNRLYIKELAGQKN